MSSFGLFWIARFQFKDHPVMRYLQNISEKIYALKAALLLFYIDFREARFSYIAINSACAACKM
jgi:hypothetical protein